MISINLYDEKNVARLSDKIFESNMGLTNKNIEAEIQRNGIVKQLLDFKNQEIYERRE